MNEGAGKSTSDTHTSAHRNRLQRIALIAGPLLLVVLALAGPFSAFTANASSALDLPADHPAVIELARGAQNTLAIAVLMLIWWVTEAVPLAVTALLPGLLLPLLHVTGQVDGGLYSFTAKTALARYADPIIYLFLGSFLLAGGMRKTGLDKRLTYRVLNLPFVGRTTGGLLFGVMVVTAVLSMLISNTATTALMIPVALGILALLDEAPGRSALGTAMMLGVCWAASIGGIGTLIGSPPNGIAARILGDATGVDIGFVDWMSIGLPVAACGLAAAWILLMLLFRPNRRLEDTVRDSLESQRRQLGRVTADQVVVLLVVCFALLLWLTQRQWPRILPVSVYGLIEWFGVHEIGLLCGLLLFIVPVPGRRGRAVLDWSDAGYVDWGILILFGGGLSLSSALFRTGVIDVLAGVVVGWVHGWPSLACVVVIVLLTCFLTEITSNTAITAMLAPLLIGVAPRLGLEPETVCVMAAMAASVAFMLPIATPPNALVYATGYMRLSQMMRAGLVMNLVGCGVLITLTYLLRM